MKPKIDLDKIAEMTYLEYEKMFRKEVIRAQKVGQTNCVVLSDFEFKDQIVGTLVVLGHYTGALTKFYKQIKRSRKDKKDFAVGTAVFEQLPNASSTLHIHLEDGKAKPKKLLRNGKKLFKKSGLVVDIFVGEANKEQDHLLSTTEEVKIEQEAQKESDKRSIKRLVNDYLYKLALVKDNTIPNLQQNKCIPRDLQLVRQLYIVVEAVEAEIPQLTEKEKRNWLDKATAIANKKNQMASLYKNVKSALAATNNGIDLNVITNPPYNAYYQQVEKTLATVPTLVQKLEAVTLETQEPTKNIVSTTTQCLKQLQDLILSSSEHEKRSREVEIREARKKLEIAYKKYLAWKEEQRQLALKIEQIQKNINKKEQLLKSFQAPFDQLMRHKGSQDLLPHEKSMLDSQLSILHKLIQLPSKLPQKLQQKFSPQLSTWQKRLATLDNIKKTHPLAKDITNVQGRYGTMPTVDPTATPEQQATQLKTLKTWLQKIEQADNEIGNSILDYYNNASYSEKQPGGDCFAVAKTRVKKIWKEVTKTDLYDNLPASPISSVNSRTFFNLVWNCVPNKHIPEAYNGLGSAGAMAWAGKGDLITEDEIWAGKLETGAVIQVWAQKSDLELLRAGKSTTNIGHSFIFLKYIYTNGVITAMQIADQGTGWDNSEGIGRDTFEFWIGANLK